MLERLRVALLLDGTLVNYVGFVVAFGAGASCS